MTSSLLIVLLTSIANLVLGSLVYSRNPRAIESRAFLAMTLSVTAWSIANYFTDHVSGEEPRLIFMRLAFLTGFYVVLATAVFTYFFGNQYKFTTKKQFLCVSIVLASALVVGLSNQVIQSIRIRSDGTDAILGGLYYPFILSLFLLFVISVGNISRTYVQNKNTIVKAQLKIMTFGIALSFLFGIVTNFAIPTITGNWAIAKIGPLLTIILVGSFSYAIVKHRLFDIRVFVVRGFVYTITTTILVTIYSAISLPIKDFLISANTDTYVSTLAEIILLGIFGISFYPLKLYFDKVTTKYFFRDHYNVQEVLKNINAILSVSVDLDKMLHRVGGIIKNTLLIEHCAFIIDEDQITGQIRYINVGKSVSRVSLPQGVDKLFRGRNVVVVDQLKEEGVEQELKKYLVFQSIAVLVKLRGVEEHGRVENQGYIVLGNKKSGKSFSGQDEKMLDILSAQLAVAAQNLVHIDEIVHFNIKLQDEITDATKELKVKNKKLRELDQTKDEFVSMASHQLRTPLTAIKGYLSMVIEGDAGDLKPGQKQLLDQAYMSTQRMVYLIADLLNLSRLKTGKFVITPQPTSLAGMIEGEIHQIQETAKSRGHKVSFMCDPSIPDLMLDDMKTRQVIMNFIDNAIYYTPAGGNIQVFLEQKDGKVIFKVTDNGIGVAKEDQKELFAKFYRAGNARKARPDGTGLGLYMAKMVIDAEGGELIFSSEEGKGSTFGFSFDIEQLKSPAISQIK